jgi:DNA-directed RNA polymerase II subunit RPB1
MSSARNPIEQKPSKIIGIQFSVLSPDEIRRGSVAEITSRDTYVNNKPVIGGLFDPRMGILDPGLVCPTDGLNYMQTPGYFGHINLARPVFYIQYLNTILKILRCVCTKCSKLLINKVNHAHIMNMDSRKRWQYVFARASKIKTCGQETEDGCGCRQPSRIKKDGLATIFAEWDEQKSSAESKSEKHIFKLIPETVLKIFRRISDEDVKFMGFSPIWSRPDWFICQVLAVPPPAVRPSVMHDAQQRSEDDISHIIVNIIKANKTLQQKIQQNAAPKVIDDWHTVLQYYIATMIDNRIPGVAAVAQRSGRALKSIKERLIGKTGRVRGNLMGKRVDYSARSVIGPDPNLSIKELGVPLDIAMNITFPATVNRRNKRFLTKLVVNGPDKYPGANILEKNNGYNRSLRHTDRNSIILEEGDVVHRHLLNGDPVLFNRQPTLHRMSMMCHIVRIMKKGKTFRMNVADTKPYNADFDGDEMNLHAPQDEESAAELRYLAAVPKQIISPASNSPIVGIFQDSLLGAYRFTRQDIKFTPRAAMNLLMAIKTINPAIFKQNAEITNFDILSQILPPMSCKFKNKLIEKEEDKKTSNNIVEISNGKYLRGQMEKSVLGGGSKGLIHSIFNDFGSAAATKFIDDIQAIITDYMKISAYSVGINDLIADNETNQKINTAITQKKMDVRGLIDELHIGTFENKTGKSNEEEFETKVNIYLNKAAEEAGKIGRKSLDKDNRFVIMVNAGSKGSILNIAQMVSCLGQQNVDGKRIPYGYEDRTLPCYNKYDDSPEARGFVESSFIQGLTPEELYFHAMGGRTGLIDTAVKTSTTGYIQRRLIKGNEDLKVAYDMTVRNNKNKIIQYKYGGDNIETTKIESQIIDLAQMTIEEVYAHFQVPLDDTTNEMFTTNYTKEAVKRLKRQKGALNAKLETMINEMIINRKHLVENVFKFTNKNNVHLSVNFKRIMQNLQHQLNIQKTSMVDITPLEIYKILDFSLDKLKRLPRLAPTKLFEIVYYYYLTPKNLLMFHRFNRKAIILLTEKIENIYKKSIVNPGEMVGIIAAQSIGEPTTQMTLNTFHFAGVASKSNVTRGVPRIEEILSISDNPKQPSTTIFLPHLNETNHEKALELKHDLEFTSMRDITKNVNIYFEPNPVKTVIEEDKQLLEEYIEFQKLIKECSNVELEKDDKKDSMSKFIIRFVFDREAMLDKNISMDDVHFAIKNSFKKEVMCMYSDLNSDKLIFRIRLVDSLTKSNKQSLDQSDEIYMLKNIQDNLLDKLKLRGIKNIPKIIIRKMTNSLRFIDGSYKLEDSWVLDTVGTNLLGILGTEGIDATRTYSNHIHETNRVLGIEAARQTIYNEILESFEFNGTYINSHHLELLCDRMTCNEKMTSIFRHGINNDNIGPIAKASFEETPEMFLRAARHAELDPLTGVSANIMCGQQGNFGTSAFQVMLDINKMNELGEKSLEEKVELEKALMVDDTADICSKQNIDIGGDIKYIQSKDMGKIDDDYDPGF